jgi:hypothetical protein
MFGKNKRRTHRYYRKSKRIKVNFWYKLGSKLLWFAIVFLSILLLVYAFSFYKRLSQPEASEFGSPVYEGGELVSARVQILDGCTKSKDAELVQKIARKLELLKANHIRYEVVDMGKCDFASAGGGDSLASESMIIDRTDGGKNGSPSEIALLTAGALGIQPVNVVCRKMKDNYQDVTLTLLIGNDYRTLLSTLSR